MSTVALWPPPQVKRILLSARPEAVGSADAVVTPGALGAFVALADRRSTGPRVIGRETRLRG